VKGEGFPVYRAFAGVAADGTAGIRDLEPAASRVIDRRAIHLVWRGCVVRAI
jgi:hypothetical protein